MQKEDWGGPEAYGTLRDSGSDAVAAASVDSNGEPEGDEGKNEFHGEDGGVE